MSCSSAWAESEDVLKACQSQMGCWPRAGATSAIWGHVVCRLARYRPVKSLAARDGLPEPLPSCSWGEDHDLSGFDLRRYSSDRRGPGIHKHEL